MFPKAEKGAGVALEHNEARGRDVTWAVGPCIAAVVKVDEVILHVAIVAQRRSAEPRCLHERIEIPLQHGVNGRDVVKLHVDRGVVAMATRRGDLFSWDAHSSRWWPFGNAFEEEAR